MRERNPYAKRYTFDTFKVKYFGTNHNVPNRLAREFWSDFNYAFVGGLNRYIKESTETR